MIRLDYNVKSSLDPVYIIEIAKTTIKIDRNNNSRQ